MPPQSECPKWPNLLSYSLGQTTQTMNNAPITPDNAKSTRRHLSADDKVKLLRLHLLEGKAISTICDEHTRQLIEKSVRKGRLTLGIARTSH